MFNTDFGPFDGDSWEQICQLAFKLKYCNQNYQSIPATPGDFGIEGFTRDGTVFQCYCPDFDLPAKDLYDKQRDKITTDIAKIKQYADDLQRLGVTSIKKWILVTPRMGKNDLLAHCISKKSDVLAWGENIIDPSFDILIHEIGDYATEFGQILSSKNKKLFLKPENNASDGGRMTDWKKIQEPLVTNANRKNKIRISQVKIPPGKTVQTINKFTDHNVRSFLNGMSILNKWQKIIPENYTKFMSLIGKQENDLEITCVLNQKDPNIFFEETKVNLNNLLTRSFPEIDTLTIEYLVDYVISDWILRCPLDFE